MYALSAKHGEPRPSGRYIVRGGVMRNCLLKKITALALAGACFLCVWGGKLPCVKAWASNPYGWEKIASYTTYFSENDKGRCANIAIAAALVDGIAVQPYGEFSFNQTVGKRTRESGFREAKIIVKGEYVLGVGGGVCQVSTTLYNAALKSGLTVLEYHPHSLRVGYVSPSRDAMVSTECDLQLYNPHSFPVYLSVEVFKNGLRVSFYGKNEGYRYEIIAQILEEVPPPAPIVKQGDKEGVLRAAQNGVKSEAYLEKYKGKNLLSRKKLRMDQYRPIQGIILEKK